MSLRFGTLYSGGVYHVFNRGVDKRVVFETKDDKEKFEKLLKYCNTEKQIGSIRQILEGDIENKFDTSCPLVDILCVALVDNHYHLLLKQISENGISRFMQKISSGYTNSFNYHHKRSGSLFQGRFKYIECKNDNQIMRLCSYINLNYQIHNLSPWRAETSHDYYLVKFDEKRIRAHKYEFVNRNYCLDLFGSVSRYEKLSQDIVSEITKRRKNEKNDLFLE